MRIMRNQVFRSSLIATVSVIAYLFIGLEMKLVSQSIEIQKESSYHSDTLFAQKWRKTAEVFRAEGKLDSSNHYFYKSSSIFGRVMEAFADTSSMNLYLYCLTYIGRNYVDQALFDQADSILKISLKIGREKFGIYQTQMGTAYFNLGVLHEEMENYDVALTYFGLCTAG